MYCTVWGKMIRQLREEQNISLEKLARGFCSKQALSNMERGDVEMDKLLMDLILQRLGKSTDRQEPILSWETYHLEETIDCLEQSIWQGELEKAGRCRDEFLRLIVRGKNRAAGEYVRLDKGMKRHPDSGWGVPFKLDRVREMYWHRLHAQWAYWIDKDEATAMGELFAATELTMPGWSKQKLEHYAVSTVEMENLLALARLELTRRAKEYGKLFSVQSKQSCQEHWILPESTFVLRDREKGRKVFTVYTFLKECMEYIRNAFTDGQERAKIFAKCAWLLSCMEEEQGNLPEACRLCEEAVEGLRNYGMSAFLVPVLKKLTACYKRASEFSGRAFAAGRVLAYPWQRDWKRLIARNGRYLTALRHVYERCGLSFNKGVSIFEKSYQKFYHLDYELIHGERLVRGMTREKMSEGIYQSGKTLGGLEAGKKGIHKKKFNMLMGQISMEKERYNTFIVSDSYAVLELREELDQCMGRKEYERAGELFRELETKLDTGNAENIRILLHLRWLLEFCKDGAACQEMLKKCWLLLGRTYHIAKGVETDGIPNRKLLRERMFYRAPMRAEAGIINQIALLLQGLGYTEEAQEVYKALIESMKKSDVAACYRYGLYALPFENLAKCLRSAELCQEALRFELACGKLNLLGFSMMVWACAIEDDSPDRAESREMILDAYYLCELSKNYKYREEIKKYHNDLFGSMELD
ncbi:MAG: helix-turn-helix transcriptional regulator [Lachnospiraceae bacterium]|nr:helix-turn-helix transcriptional regulator [Lachnospiraceae bacterium]